MNRRLLVPFLMGQRRDGLARVSELDDQRWEVLAVPGCEAAVIDDTNQKLSNMGVIYAKLARSVKAAVERDEMPVCIAGDCVSTLGVLGGLQQARRAPDRILWLDAHGDFHTWATTQTKYVGGMPLAMLVGRPDRRRGDRDAVEAMRRTIGVTPFPERQIVLSDARDLDPGEKEALRDSGITCCPLDEVLGHLNPHERLYLHFDTDVLDAESEMPALKYHVKAGPRVGDLAGLFQRLRGHHIVAVSVSAWHEELDTGNRAALTCLSLLKQLIDEPRPSTGASCHGSGDPRTTRGHAHGHSG